LRAFTAAVDSGLVADLVYVGPRSRRSVFVNDEIDAAVSAGYPITWIDSASDDDVAEVIATSSAFLSIGIEGYGIPVLESLRMGTPVLYDGIQPAADLMLGKGTLRIDGTDSEALRASLMEAPKHLDQLRDEVDPEGVPTWRAFVDDVAMLCR
jgi:hypothetical protein